MDAYRWAILIVFALSGHSLAAHVHARWLGERGVEYRTVYIVIMAFVVVWGHTLVAPGLVFGGAVSLAVLSLPVGLAVGLLAFWGDRTIVRRVSRRRRGPDRSSPSGGARWSSDGGYDARVGRLQRVPLGGQARRRRDLPAAGRRPAMLPAKEREDARSVLVGLVAIGVLEEVIYRGLLVEAAFTVDHAAVTGIALGGIVVAFALAHLVFGTEHVLAKLPLSALAMVATLALGNVVSAVVAHVVFNVKIWLEWRALPRFDAST